MEKNTQIYIFDKNKNSSEILKFYLIEIQPSYIIKTFENYNEGFEEIKKNNSNPIIFFDINESQEDISETLDMLKIIASKIVITSVNYSTDLIIKSLRIGAIDFLPKPILKESLKKTVSKLEHKNISDSEINSKIISIYSNKGGIGKTTIATNLAIELAKTTQDKVALIDLNLQLGDISTFLNLEPSFDVAYAIKNLIEKNNDNILNTFEKYNNTNLYVLSDPCYIEQAESISPYQIELLFENLRKVFPYIIIDMSSSIDPNTLKILDKSDWILFTSIVNIPAIRNAQRCLNLFSTRNYPKDKVKIIINRYMENDDIKLEDIETSLGEKIYWKIPNNYFSIMESINKGIPVSDINRNSNIANSFQDLASKITDDFVKQTVDKYKIG